jgi:hypothetical protein
LALLLIGPSQQSAARAGNTSFPNARIDDRRSSDLNQLEPSKPAGFPNVDRSAARAVLGRLLAVSWFLATEVRRALKLEGSQIVQLGESETLRTASQTPLV